MCAVAVYKMHVLNHDERLCNKDEAMSMVYNDFPIFYKILT